MKNKCKTFSWLKHKLFPYIEILRDIWKLESSHTSVFVLFISPPKKWQKLYFNQNEFLIFNTGLNGCEVQVLPFGGSGTSWPKPAAERGGECWARPWQRCYLRHLMIFFHSDHLRGKTTIPQSDKGTIWFIILYLHNFLHRHQSGMLI